MMTLLVRALWRGLLNCTQPLGLHLTKGGGGAALINVPPLAITLPMILSHIVCCCVLTLLLAVLQVGGHLADDRNWPAPQLGRVQHNADAVEWAVWCI